MFITKNLQDKLVLSEIVLVLNLRYQNSKNESEKKELI
jgi:hypothetical protein